MVILDTNVLSELMARRPQAAVMAWADAQRRDQLVTTAVNVMELHSGLHLIKPGKRRQELATMLDWTLDELLGGRVLNFDRRASLTAAELYAKRRALGQTVDLRDTMIGAIALGRRIPIATRNTIHFGDLDVKVIDPWKDAG